MNRAIDSMKIHTAPMKVHEVESSATRLMNKRVRLLSELDQAETRIRAEKEKVTKRRDSEQTKYNIAINLGDRTTLARKVEYATRSIIAEWTWKSEAPKMLHALYLIRKLRSAINGGLLLREERDVELAFIRQVVRGITT